MATYYVATNGNDTILPANNSLQSPWKTLHLSARKLAAGDTLYVRGGTYSLPVNGEVVLNKANSTLSAYNNETVIIDGRATWKTGTVANPIDGTAGYEIDQNPVGTGNKQPLILISATGVTVYGISIKNSAGEGISVDADGSGALIDSCNFSYTHSSSVIIKNGDNCIVRDCYSTDSNQQGSGGAITARFSSGHLFERCEITRYLGEGFSWAIADHSTFKDCIAYNGNKAAYYFGIGDYNTADGCLAFTTTNDIVAGTPPVGMKLTAEITNGVIGTGIGTIVKNCLIVGHSPNFLIAGGVDAGVINPAWGMDDIRVFNNTFVDAVPGSQGYNVGIYNKNSVNNANNGPCWFVNNLIVQRDNLPILNTTAATNYTDWNVSHNLWSKAPPNARFWNSSTDVVGNPQLSSAHVGLENTEDFDINDYLLTQSSTAAINKGTTSYYAASGVTITDDYFDSTRSGTPDMGFHEFNATTEDSIAAAFSGTPTSGDVPLTVAFTNSSTATRSIVQAVWNFGDGDTQTVTGTDAVSHVYATAGTYTVSLTVQDINGLTDSETKTDYITVNSAGTGGNVAYSVGSFAATTTSNSQTVAHGCSETPKAIIFVPSGGVTAETDRAGASLGFGAATASGQFAIAMYAADAEATTITRRGQTSSGAILLYNGTAAKVGSATWDATDITITWDSAPPVAYLIGFMAIGGSSVQANVTSTALTDVGVTSTVDVGFAPSLLLAGMTFTTSTNSFNGTLPIGVMTSGLQAAATIFFSNNAAAAAAEGIVHNGYLISDVRTPAHQVQATLTGSGYTLTPRTTDIDESLPVLALRYDGPGIYAAIVDSPTSTGNTDNTAPAMELAALLTVATGLQVVDTEVNTADAGIMAIGLYDGTTEFWAGVSNDVGDDPTDTQSLASDALTIKADSGAAMFAGATTFVTDGYRRAMSATNGTARKWLVIGFEEASADPIAGFTLNTTTGIVDVTTFRVTDTSDDNGLGTITYDYDWDDGTAHATTASPTHVYAAAGTFTITQTVTAGGNTDTFTADVTVTGAPAEAAWTITGASDEGYVPVGGSVTVTQDVTPASGETITNYAWQLYTGSEDTLDKVIVYQISGASVTSFSRVMTAEGVFGIQLAVTQSDGLVTTAHDDAALTVSWLPLPAFTVTLDTYGTTASDGTIEAQMPATVTITDASDGNGNTITERIFTIKDSSGATVDTIVGKASFVYSFGAQDTYTITLDVTTVAGTSTLDKTNVVAVTYGEVDIVGPPYPAQVATWTRDDIRGDYRHTHSVEHTTEAEPNTLVATDTRGGTELTYLAVNSPLTTLYNSAAAPVMRVKGYIETAGADSGIAGNVIKVKANAFVPWANYGASLGSQTNKWASVSAGSLLVETLVAQEVKADIGGRVIIGSTNELASDLLASAGRLTTIDFKYDTDTTNNDFYWLEGDGKYEIIKLTSAPVATDLTDGRTVYRATCDRQANTAGEYILHDWQRGAACINTGGQKDTSGATVPVGWIDLYARNSMKNKGLDLNTLDGPTIVGNVRWASGPRDYAPVYALGNLRNRYGQSDSNTWGVAVGWDRDSTAYMVALPEAISFYGSGREELLKFSAASGLQITPNDSAHARRNAITWSDDSGVDYGSVSLYSLAGVITNVRLTAYGSITGSSTIQATSSSGTASLKVVSAASGRCVVIDNIPTSAAGLPTGALWSNSGVINIV